MLIIFLFLNGKFAGKLFIEFIQFGNLLLRLFLLAFEFLKYFIPILFLFFIAFDVFLEVFDFKVDLYFFMLKYNFLLIECIFQLSDSMLIFTNDHLTFFQVAFEVLCFFQQAFLETFFLSSFFLYDFEFIKEILPFSCDFLIELINFLLLFFEAYLELSFQTLVFFVLEFQLVLNKFVSIDSFVELFDFLLFDYDG